MKKGRMANRFRWMQTEKKIADLEAKIASIGSEVMESGAYACCGYHDCVCVVYPAAGAPEVRDPNYQPVNVELWQA